MIPCYRPECIAFPHRPYAGRGAVPGFFFKWRFPALSHIGSGIFYRGDAYCGAYLQTIGLQGRVLGQNLIHADAVILRKNGKRIAAPDAVEVAIDKFYFSVADIMSRDGKTITEKLNIILDNDNYKPKRILRANCLRPILISPTGALPTNGSGTNTSVLPPKNTSNTL